jgi:hypothetical protein
MTATDASAAPSPRERFRVPSDAVSLTARLREANEFMTRAFRDEGPFYEVAYFCECGRPDCRLPVWLSVAAFQARIAAGGAILLTDQGHTSSAPASMSQVVLEPSLESKSRAVWSRDT